MIVMINGCRHLLLPTFFQDSVVCGLDGCQGECLLPPFFSPL